MRVLLNDLPVPDLAAGDEVDDPTLARAYAYPEEAGSRPWVRANMVSTLDGAATGPDGVTDSINTAPDGHVFALLRALCDVVVVGASTTLAEGYRPPSPPETPWSSLREGRAPAPQLVAVSSHAEVPETLLVGDGTVLLATCEQAGTTATGRARNLLGDDQVIVAGGAEVDPSALVDALTARGLTRILCEGGPRLLRSMVVAGAVDEVCQSVTPLLIAGAHRRILVGDPVDAAVVPRLLLESHGTLLGRWEVSRSRQASSPR